MLYMFKGRNEKVNYHIEKTVKDIEKLTKEFMEQEPEERNYKDYFEKMAKHNDKLIDLSPPAKQKEIEAETKTKLEALQGYLDAAKNLYDYALDLSNRNAGQLLNSSTILPNATAKVQELSDQLNQKFDNMRDVLRQEVDFNKALGGDDIGTPHKKLISEVKDFVKAAQKDKKTYEEGGKSNMYKAKTEFKQKVKPFQSLLGKLWKGVKKVAKALAKPIKFFAACCAVVIGCLAGNEAALTNSDAKEDKPKRPRAR